MGIFYNPPSQTSYPNIGGQQPNTPSEIATNPATNPAPSVFNASQYYGAQAAIFDAWYSPLSPFLTLLLDTGTEPYEGPVISPPISGPSPFNPPPLSIQVILNAHYFPANPFLTLLLDDDTEPYQEPLLPPPSGPQFPPVSLQSTFNSYNYPPFFTLLLDIDTEPYQGPLLPPPSGPAATPKLLGNSIQAVYNAWNYPPFFTLLLDIDTEPYQGPLLPPPSQPFNPTPNSIQAVYNAWNAPSYQAALQSFPPQQPAATPPPPLAGFNRIMAALNQDAWPPPPIEIEIGNSSIFLLVYTPIGSTTPISVLINWNQYQQVLQQLAHVTQSGPVVVPFVPPENALFDGVLDAWVDYQKTVIERSAITPPITGATPPPLSTNTNGLIAAVYQEDFPEPIIFIELSSGGNTIFFTYYPIGSSVPITVLLSWEEYQKFLLQQEILIAAAISVQPSAFVPTGQAGLIAAINQDAFPQEAAVIELDIVDILPITSYIPIGNILFNGILDTWADYQKTVIEYTPPIAPLIPPPTPGTPPPIIGSPVPLPVLNAWLPPDAAKFQFQPLTHISPTLPTPSNPPFVGGAQNPLSDRLWFSDYNPPPPTFMGGEQPWTTSKIAPINPTTNAPPILLDINRLMAELNIEAFPQEPILIEYPVAPTILFTWYPVGSSVPETVLISWADYQKYIIEQQSVPIAPNSPPVQPQASAPAVPNAIYTAWNYQPPLILLMGKDKEPYSAEQAVPPSGPVVQVPPSSALQAILNAWDWQTPAGQPQTAPLSIQQIAKPQLGAPIQIQNILDAWNVAPPQPSQGELLAPPSAVPQPYSNPLTAVYDAWIAQQPAPQAGAHAAPTLPIPSPPPVIGSRVPAAVLNAWITPDSVKNQFQPNDVLAPILPIPSPPPIVGSRVGQAILDSWYYQPEPLPQFSGKLTLGPILLPFETIYAKVTITAYGATTTVTAFGANVTIET